MRQKMRYIIWMLTIILISTAVSAQDVSSFKLGFASCEYTSVAQVLLLGLCVLIAFAIYTLIFWINIPLLSIIYGLIVMFFGWYVASCFMFAIFLFIILGLAMWVRAFT